MIFSKVPSVLDSTKVMADFQRLNVNQVKTVTDAIQIKMSAWK